MDDKQHIRGSYVSPSDSGCLYCGSKEAELRDHLNIAVCERCCSTAFDTLEAAIAKGQVIDKRKALQADTVIHCSGCDTDGTKIMKFIAGSQGYVCDVCVRALARTWNLVGN